MDRTLFSLIALLFYGVSFSQTAFKLADLSQPKNNWDVILDPFAIEETEVFDTTLKTDPNGHQLCMIPNALRSSDYKQTDKWITTRDSATVKAVSIVFSKYPIRRNGYQMNQKLLANRLIHLFELDKELNTDSIEWNIVLQTNCINDDQVNTLFHGVVIHYELRQKAHISQNQETELIVSDEVEEIEVVDEFIDQTTEADRLNNITYLTNSDDIPEEIMDELAGKTLEEKEAILTTYLESKTDLEDENHVIDEAYKKERKTEVEEFISTYSYAKDNVVKEVLDRNPDWKKVLVVADWTGSMYGYGAQVLDWHIENFHRSEISYFTLFNDGDRRMKKIVGKTKGIYHEEADNMRNVLALYKLVMMRGGGGDGPENDLEAILAGMEEFPDFTEIVLIADNNACVRDMALLDQIDRPVRVILCGYNKHRGVNPQYVEIAEATGGSIHTIEEDIEDMTVERDGDEVTKMEAGNLTIGRAPCTGYAKGRRFFLGITFHKLSTARLVKKDVINLILEKERRWTMPRVIGRMRNLETLDMSDNRISRIPNKIYKLPVLKHLDLSHNQIKKISKKIGQLKHLQTLNLSMNKMEELPRNIFQLRYLQSMDLSHNYIKELPYFTKLKRLTHLNLSYNKLKTIPDNVHQLTSLRELDLSNNRITHLPEKIGSLKNLEVLDLSHNELKELPKRITRFRRLQQLDVSGNHLDAENIARLKKYLPNTEIIF